MRVVRSLFRMTHVVALLLVAVVDWWVRRPRVGAEGAAWIHRWCRRLVKAVGVEWCVVGELPTRGAVVSNHLSYLDVLLYSAVSPFVMVAKSEVREWPLFGWLTSRAGTVYVTRGGGPSTYPAVNAAMAEAYRTGLPVLFFPEGTTTDGSDVLPFRRGLFHSVLNEEIPLRVSALRYSLEDTGASVEEDVCWWGDALLAPHLWRLLGLRGVSAEICFGGEMIARRDRFVLSEGAREAVAELYVGSGVKVSGETELVEAF